MSTPPNNGHGKGKIINFPDRLHGKALGLSKPEPWEDDVIGSELAEEIAATIRRYVVLSESSTVAITLWVMLTYCFEEFTICPILAILSPEKQCGKTTLLDVLYGLVSKPLLAASLTAATVFRVIEKERPTLLIDEADTYIRKDEALRGVLNSGNRCSGNVLRTVGESYEVRSSPTYSPKAIALIGSLPDTLQDRSICITLQRKAKNEKVTRFLSHRTEALKITARKATQWADSFHKELQDIEPNIPDFLSNRPADNWYSLLAIADLIGDGWGKRARDAARDIITRTLADTQSIRTLLLADIKEIFDRKDRVDRLRSSAIVSLLGMLEERPWGEWNRGNQLTTNQLAFLLKPFGIKSKTLRFKTESKPAKGFMREQFEHAWEHYLPDDESNTSVTDEVAS